MGNVFAKLEESENCYKGRSFSGTSGARGTPPSERRRGMSLVIGNSARSRANSSGSQMLYKKKSTRERDMMKEGFAKQLVVRYDESVDGGYLAPHACYTFDKLDYDPNVVRSLITSRRLAPFYIPLEDFDESWTKDELIKIVEGLPLHAAMNENPEEFEDVPVGNLKKQSVDDLVDRTLSKKEQRRQRSKIFKARLHLKRNMWQEQENESFLEHKLECKRDPSSKRNLALASPDLDYTVYKKGAECPICFLYYPEPLNHSRCCLQPICTECFVQIKRAEPHFPHEEVDPTKPVTADDEKDPNLLISEPANCAYCATPNFGVTYQPPLNRRTGIGGIPPGSYKAPLDDDTDDSESDDDSFRAPSKSPEDPGVVTSDMIRPSWKAKLDKERMRLARRSANATAIHVSNQLVDPEHPSRRGSNVDYEPSTSLMGRSPRAGGASLSELENQMIEQAIRLSLIEEEERKSSRPR
ncbi:SIP5 (YMR140W) [Zygosaccharomyces parabailii]|nr:SIP5 (YMR140W) [Zygosaccharomyces parabailii]